MRAATALLALLCFGVPACSPGGDANEQAGTRPALLDQLLGRTTSDQATRLFVEDRIVACMAAQGFSYWPEPVLPDDDMGDDAYHTEEFRRAYGFGIASHPDEAEGSAEAVSEASSRNDMHLANLSPVEFDQWVQQEAVCFDAAWTEAEAAIAEAGEQLPPELHQDVIDIAFRASAELAPAMAEWSRCMSDEGLGYDSQLTMHAELQRRHAELDPSDHTATDAFADEEKVTAVADLRCERQHLTADIERIEADLERELKEQIGRETLYDND